MAENQVFSFLENKTKSEQIKYIVAQIKKFTPEELDFLISLIKKLVILNKNN